MASLVELKSFKKNIWQNDIVFNSGFTSTEVEAIHEAGGAMICGFTSTVDAVAGLQTNHYFYFKTGRRTGSEGRIDRAMR